MHENHIGWDVPNNCFDLSQLSKELKTVFKNAGIRKRDLKDKHTAMIIADAILNQPLPERAPAPVPKNKKTQEKLESLISSNLPTDSLPLTTLQNIQSERRGSVLPPPLLMLNQKLGENVPKAPTLDLLKSGPVLPTPNQDVKVI